MATTKPREGRVVEGVLVGDDASWSGVMVVVVEEAGGLEDEAKECEGLGR